MKKVIIAGCGFAGAVSARILAEKGYKVRLIEKRNHIAGNMYDYIEDDIRIHAYGPHIFHTSNYEVYEFLSKFTEWEPYEHKVLGFVDGKYVPIPFNLTSLMELYSADEAAHIKEILINELGEGRKVPIAELSEHPDPNIRKLANFVYEKVFHYYTLKQWGMEPAELGGNVMGRVPVYISYEDRYFTDSYQFMPKDGFTKLFENLVNHENIDIELSYDVLNVIKLGNDGNIYVDGELFLGKFIFTGKLDELFGYCYGDLPYRSLDFQYERINTNSFQPAAVVNYPCSEKFTRITEFSKFTCPMSSTTVIVREYPKACTREDTPFYPIPRDENMKLYSQYREKADKYSNLLLIGRLASYKYSNMDGIVADAINLCKEL